MIEEIGTDYKQQRTIFEKIVFIMEDVDYVQKGEARVNGQYSFVSHDAVTAKLHPLFVKHKICVIPSVETITQENNRTSIMLNVTFVNSEAPNDSFTVKYPGYGVDGGDKGPGKAISYAFKYALLKTFCLETGDDPDQDANAQYEPPKCIAFELSLPHDMTQKDRDLIVKFLEYIGESSKKHIEDIKHEAVERMGEFLGAFKNWKSKTCAKS